MPFVFNVLSEYESDPITNSVVREHICDRFGLEIPERTVEIVLKRISQRYSLKRNGGVYRKTGDLPDPQIVHKQADAERHIGAVLNGLRQFSQGTINPIANDKEAVIAICAFLAEFDITCLRAYLRGTAIPDLEGAHQTDIVLVSNYVQHVRQIDPERFNSFLILVQGHMLANALMCPDLDNAPATYKNVIFYLDTPLLVRRLGSEGEAKQASIRELISLLSKLGGKVAAFSHSRDELHRVLRGAAVNLETPRARGSIIFEARKCGITKSDLLPPC